MRSADEQADTAHRISLSLQKNWQKKELAASLLFPISLVFRALVCVRRTLFRLGIRKIQKVGIPVIVVGNVVAGGSGKTPTVISIVLHLQAQGLMVGVVSRGYGRTGKDYAQVVATSEPTEVGDEPLLIFKATGATVFVGPSRFEAAHMLRQTEPGVQVLVCDDGLQHYGIYRDIEVCVFDNRGCGNGWTLPAGPLREPWPRELLVSVGQSAQTCLVLHTGTHPAFGGFTAKRTLSHMGVTKSGRQVSLDGLVTSAQKPFFAIAAIAQPEAFFDMLRALPLPLAGTRGFADHSDFRSLDRSLGHNHTILCTEKDAVKLWHIVPDALAVPLIQTIDPAFFTSLDALLERHFEAKLSSPHG